MDRVKIGLFGFGCVGQGLYKIIEQESLPVEIVRIGVKNRDKVRSLPADRFTYNSDDLLNDPDIEIIVELIDDAESAFGIVKRALLQGKKVVTANKKMVAENLEELLFLRNGENNLRYEAAVCGSIPIVNTIDDFYSEEVLQGFSGIYNGSSNFILTKIRESGLDYGEALKLAQELGFAESDPTLDVGGYDSLNKLVILLAHGYGITVSPKGLPNIGIQNLDREDFKFADSRNLKIKLVAKATRIGQAVRAYVMPCFINKENPLWSVEEEYNAVLVNGRYSNTHLYTGKGAGSFPTAASVLADLNSVISDKRYRYGKLAPEDIQIDLQGLLKVYLRYQHPRHLQEFNFEKVYGEGRGQNGGFVLGDIRLSNLWSLQSYIEDNEISVVDMSSISGELQVDSMEKEQMVYQ